MNKVTNINIFLTAITVMLSTATGLSEAAVDVLREDTKNTVLLVTEQFILGDNDTLTTARAMNLEQAKKSAADYAGSYTEATTVVTGNKLTKEQVRTLTAAYTEVLSYQDSRSVNRSGSMVLTTKAKIQLSKEAVADGLAKLKSDPERRRKMAALEKDNQKLRNQLFELSRKINNGKSRTDLMAQRDAILESLNKNRKASRQVFEQGTLYQLAVLGGDEFEMAKKDIEDNVFSYLRHEAHITTGRPQFTKNSNGTYNIAVPVSWSFSLAAVNKVLGKYLETTDRHRKMPPSSLAIAAYRNTRDRQKKPYTEKLFNYLAGKAIVLRISAGNYTGYLPVGHTGSIFASDDYFIQSSGSPGQKMISLLYRNPVLIRNVSEAALKSMTSLSASLEVIDKANLRGWMYE